MKIFKKLQISGLCAFSSPKVRIYSPAGEYIYSTHFLQQIFPSFSPDSTEDCCHLHPMPPMIYMTLPGMQSLSPNASLFAHFTFCFFAQQISSSNWCSSESCSDFNHISFVSMELHFARGLIYRMCLVISRRVLLLSPSFIALVLASWSRLFRKIMGHIRT